MNTYKQLNTLSEKLTLLLEEAEATLENINNTELYNEIDNNVKSQIENALTDLDMIIDDLDNGMYEDEPFDEEEEDWG